MRQTSDENVRETASQTLRKDGGGGAAGIREDHGDSLSPCSL